MSGAAAHAFTAQWDRPELPPAPTLPELLAFIAAYEAARGRALTPEERRTAHASCVYSLAFAARAEHARRAPGSEFRALLQAAAPVLLSG